MRDRNRRGRLQVGGDAEERDRPRPLPLARGCSVEGRGPTSLPPDILPPRANEYWLARRLRPPVSRACQHTSRSAEYGLETVQKILALPHCHQGSPAIAFRHLDGTKAIREVCHSYHVTCHVGLR